MKTFPSSALWCRLRGRISIFRNIVFLGAVSNDMFLIRELCDRYEFICGNLNFTTFSPGCYGNLIECKRIETSNTTFLRSSPLCILQLPSSHLCTSIQTKKKNTIYKSHQIAINDINNNMVSVYYYIGYQRIRDQREIFELRTAVRFQLSCAIFVLYNFLIFFF